MLVLSRKVGERVVIDDKVTLVIQRVAGKRVSIGIEAPAEISVVRGELQEIREQFQKPAPLPLLSVFSESDAGDLYPRAPK